MAFFGLFGKKKSDDSPSVEVPAHPLAPAATLEELTPEPDSATGAASQVPDKEPVSVNKPEAMGALTTSSPQSKHMTVPSEIATHTLQLPLNLVLRSLPLELLRTEIETRDIQTTISNATVSLPLNDVLQQLPTGLVQFKFDLLYAQIPEKFLQPTEQVAAFRHTLITLPLNEIYNRIPSDLLKSSAVTSPVSTASETLSIVPLRKDLPRSFETASVELPSPSPQSISNSLEKSSPPSRVIPPFGPQPPLDIPLTAKPPTELPSLQKPPPGMESPAIGVISLNAEKPAATGSNLPSPNLMEAPAVSTPESSMSPTNPVESLVKQVNWGELSTSLPQTPHVFSMTPSPSLEKESDQSPAAIETPESITLSPPVVSSPDLLAKQDLTSQHSIPVPSPLPVVPPMVSPSFHTPSSKPRVTRRFFHNERERSKAALCRWLNLREEAELPIYRIPEILAKIPMVAGSAIIDSDGLLLGAQLPEDISDDTLAKLCSLCSSSIQTGVSAFGTVRLFQTAIEVGPWTIYVTSKPPFTIVTFHRGVPGSPRLPKQLRKVAMAVVRHEFAA